MKRVKNGWEQKSDANLSVGARSAITHLTGNNYFPSPVPSLAEMQVFADNFDNALMQAKLGSHTAIAEKNARRAELIAALHSLGRYVDQAANGDEVALDSSGLLLTKDPSPMPPLTQPEGLTLANGVNPGELEVRINRQRGVRAYQYEYTPDPLTPASAWTPRLSSSSKTVLDGLTSDQKYWCRVGFIGSGGQLVYSEPQCRMVL